MSIKNYSREQILEGINRYKPATENRLRVIFSQEHITEANFDQACRLFANLKGTHYDDVIIIERFGNDYQKLLPMNSEPSLKTPLGEVQVNDVLRNDFCDEDDDFYIDDGGFSPDMAVYDQLMMLQCVLDDFKVLSIQMAAHRPSIVRELATAVSELLRERNALVVICADAGNAAPGALEKFQEMLNTKDFSRMMNFLNTGDAGIKGAGTLAAGALISDNWELNTTLSIPGPDEPSVLSGYSRLYQVQAQAQL